MGHEPGGALGHPAAWNVRLPDGLGLTGELRLLLIHSKRSPTIFVLTDSDVGQAVPDCRSLCTDFIENQPWLRQAEPDLLVWCPNSPFLMRGPSAIQERIDLIPEREACLPLVGWQ